MARGGTPGEGRLNCGIAKNVYMYVHIYIYIYIHIYSLPVWSSIHLTMYFFDFGCASKQEAEEAIESREQCRSATEAAVKVVV